MIRQFIASLLLGFCLPVFADTATNAPATKPTGVHTAMELPPGAGALMADATMAMREHDFKTAEQKYTDILHQDENNVYVMDFLAGAQFESSNYDACEKTVLRAISIDSADAKSQYLLGILRYRENKLDDALAALNRAASVNPTNAGTENYLGVVLGEKGQQSAAETAFRKALQADPDYADAHYNLAFVYASENPPSMELARWHYRRALELGHPKIDAMDKLLAPPKPSGP